MSRLPIPGSDDGQWGALLNNFLSQAHTDDGNLKPGAVYDTQIQDNTISAAKLDPAANSLLTKAGTATQPGDNVSSLINDAGYVTAAPVTSVAGKTGSVTLAKGDVGLANVDNTADLDKPISSLTQTALNSKANSADVVHITNDESIVGTKTFVAFPVTPSSPPTAAYHVANKKYVDDSVVAASGGGYSDESAQDAVGNILVDSSELGFVYNDATPSIAANLKPGSIAAAKLDAAVNASLNKASSAIQSGDNISSLVNDSGYLTDSPVASINNQTGAVILNADDIDDTSTVKKFVTITDVANLANLSGINTGDQDLSGLVPKDTAINGKALMGDITITKADVGLASAENTSDLNKPISAATQTALNLKANTADLGTAAVTNASDYATAAQGVNADTAVQPSDLGTSAALNAAQANGVATLDSAGKVPVGQLPSSVMKFKGTWNASTNSPTLVDGVGEAGDVYRTSVAGTQNLGSGNIAFGVGDWVIYNGTVWQQSNNGDQVSSVAGKSGVVSLVKADVGLANVDNTTDLGKPISTLTQTALDLKANSADLATVATTGSYNDLSDTPTIPVVPVDSVNSKTGAVILNADDIDDTSTVQKFVTSTDLTHLANLSGTNTGDQNLSGLVTKTTTVAGYALSSNVTLTKADVGLANVDNTTDLAKPISTATQTAINARQPLDTELTALAGLTSAANKIPMFSGSGTASLLDFKNEATLASNSATALPSQQSIKTYVDTAITAIKALTPVGSVLPYAGSSLPATGSGVVWAWADGSAISRTTYAAAFSALGTIYGAGDGSTTFNLPNLKGRVPTGYDSTQSEFNTMGKTGGEKTHTLTTAEIASHQHAPVSGVNYPTIGAGGSRQTLMSGGSWWVQTSTSLSDVNGDALTGAAGGGGAHNNLQPYIAVQYIVRVA